MDVNGRAGLRALDIFERYTLAGALTTTENVSIDAARRVDSAVYSSLEATVLPTVSLAGGARVDYITTVNRGGYFGDRDTGNGAASGFVALTAGSYRGFTLTAQASRGFRDPVLSDRYFRGPSGRGFITGNPDLDPEQSLQFDAGVRYTARRVRAAVYAYHYRITDLIERFNEGTPDDFFFRNRGRATLRGLEFESQIDLPWRLSVEVAAQMARGRAGTTGTALDGITTETGSVQLRRAIGARAFAQARAAWFADDDRPGPTERVVPGYTLVDLSGGATIWAPPRDPRPHPQPVRPGVLREPGRAGRVRARPRRLAHRRRALLICTAPRGMTPRAVRLRSAVGAADTQGNDP